MKRSALSSKLEDPPQIPEAGRRIDAFSSLSPGGSP
jgi:hypothetical protein